MLFADFLAWSGEAKDHKLVQLTMKKVNWLGREQNQSSRQKSYVDNRRGELVFKKGERICESLSIKGQYAERKKREVESFT